MPKYSLLVSLVAALLASANSLAVYVKIPVPNHSFELPGTARQQCWDGEKPDSADVPGWSSDIVAIQSGVEMGPGSTNGNWIAVLMGSDQDEGDPSIWNLLPYVIKTGDEFVLTVDARNNHNASILKMSFYYQDADGKRITVSTKTVEVTGSFKTYILRFAADDVPDAIGHELGIELDNPSTGWVGIDNVQIPQSSVPNSVGRALGLEKERPISSRSGSVPIPEPSTIAILFLGAFALFLKRR